MTSWVKFNTAVGFLLITALAVGVLSGLGGLFLGVSFMVEPYADVMDDFAEWYYDLGAYDEAREARDAATELRDVARQGHDYGVYFAVGALLITVGAIGWMAWRKEPKRGRAVRKRLPERGQKGRGARGEGGGPIVASLLNPPEAHPRLKVMRRLGLC